MTPSIVAVRSLYERGFISKEAASRILRKREDLVKEAITNIFKARASRGGFLGRLGENLVGRPARTRFGMTTSPASGPDYAQMLANVIKTVGVGGGLAAGAAGVQTGMRALSNIGAKGEIEKSRKEVVRALSSQGGEASTDTRKRHYDQAFSVLAEYAPSIASNPVAATSIVANMTAQKPVGGMPLIPSDLIKTLAETEGHIERSRAGKGFNRPFRELHLKGHPGQMQG